jgi:hypothetical protein
MNILLPPGGTAALAAVLIFALNAIVQAQKNPAPAVPAAAPEAPAQTEMQKWIATTDAQWQAAYQRDVTDVHAGELNKIKLQYLTSLEDAIKKASAAGDLDGVVALRNEQKRFGESNVFPEQDFFGEGASVKQLRAASRVSLAKLEKDHAARTKALHAKYDQVLAQAQTQLTQRQRIDDALLVKAKRDEVAAAWIKPSITAALEKAAPATIPAAGQKPAGPGSMAVASFYDRIGNGLRSPKKTTPIGSSKKGNSFTAVPSEAALLVGIAVNKGDWFGTPIISSLQPIFETRSGRIRGATVGKKTEQLPLVVEAKPGYVVSELLVSAPQNHVHGIKIIFRKLDVFHQGVVATDLYESDWLGIAQNDKSERVGDPTRPAIGLIGRADEWVSAVGLLHLP